MRTGDHRNALARAAILWVAAAALVLFTLGSPALWGQPPNQGEPPPAVEAAPTPSATQGCCCDGGGCACCRGAAAGESAATGRCRHGAMSRGKGSATSSMSCMGGGGATGGAPAADQAPAGSRMGRGMGPGMGRGMGPGMGRGMAAGNPALMHTAMSLVHRRQDIERTVEEIPGGVRTRTVVKSENEDLGRTLVEHVEGMAGLMARGGRIRNWDPLFSELFDHAAAITLEVEEIPGGVLVTETSEDPEVAKLIRAHAYKVNDFLARGHGAVHESTPLPEDYRRPGTN